MHPTALIFSLLDCSSQSESQIIFLTTKPPTETFFIQCIFPRLIISCIHDLECIRLLLAISIIGFLAKIWINVTGFLKMSLLDSLKTQYATKKAHSSRRKQEGRCWWPAGSSVLNLSLFVSPRSR